MSWYKSISALEYIFIGLFVLFYTIYIIRTSMMAYRLRSHAGALVVKLSLRTAYFVLLLIALLGPSFGEIKKEVKAIGKDILIAVDLSQSMNAKDISPSRLERTKFEIKNIIEALNSDRIGLIIFSSEAFMQCPLTFDQNALKLFVQTLNSNLVPSGGTNLAYPLKIALQKFTDQEENLQKNQTAKIIILISDGEDFSEQAEEMAEKVEENGIRLFTVGIGTLEGSKIPFGYGFKKDKQGEEVITKLNPSTLKDLANKARGRYFEVSSNKNEISQLISALEKIEGSLRDVRKTDVSANKYFYFLIIAFGLMCLDGIITIGVIKL